MWTLREYDVPPAPTALAVLPPPEYTKEEQRLLETLRPSEAIPMFVEGGALLEVPGLPPTPEIIEARPSPAELPEEELVEAATAGAPLIEALDVTDTLLEPRRERSAWRRPRIGVGLIQRTPEVPEQEPLVIANWTADHQQRFGARGVEALNDVVGVYGGLIDLTLRPRAPRPAATVRGWDIETGEPPPSPPEPSADRADLPHIIHASGSALSGHIMAGDTVQLCVETSPAGSPVVLRVTPEEAPHCRVVEDLDEDSAPRELPFYPVAPGASQLRTQWTFRRAGRYRLELVPKDTVPRSGQQVPAGTKPEGRGWVVSVEPGEGYAPQSYLEGPASDPSERVAQPQIVLVVSVDRFGNRRTRGEDALRVEAQGALRVLQVQDMHDGTYEITWMLPSVHAEAAPWSRLKVSLNGFPIAGSPFTFFPQPQKDTLGFEKAPLSPFEPPKATLPPSPRPPLFPIVPTCPPFPTLLAAKAALPPGFTSLLIPATEDQLEQYENKLMKIHTALADQWNAQRRVPLQLIDQTEGTVSIQAKQLEEVQADCAEARTWMTKLQSGLDRVYTSVQLNSVESLPVEFELDDIHSIRDRQKQERQSLQEMQRRLQEQITTMRQREQELVSTRKELGDRIATVIRNRQISLDNLVLHVRDVEHRIGQRNQRLLRQQKRRQQRDASVLPAVEALQSSRITKELKDWILSAPMLRMEKRPHELPVPPLRRPPEEAIKKEPEEDLRKKLLPDNPRRPAFWFAEGRFWTLQRRDRAPRPAPAAVPCHASRMADVEDRQVPVLEPSTLEARKKMTSFPGAAVSGLPSSRGFKKKPSSVPPPPYGIQEGAAAEEQMKKPVVGPPPYLPPMIPPRPSDALPRVHRPHHSVFATRYREEHTQS